MRVVVGTGDTLQTAGCNEFTHQYTAASLDALTAIVGKFHRLGIYLDAVTVDAEYGTCTHDIGIKSLFLQSVILCKTGFIHQIHGFLHRIADILVIRGEGEEVMVDFLYNYM